MAAEFMHVTDEFCRGFGRKVVRVEVLAVTGTNQGPVGADQPGRDADLMRNGQSEIMAAACRQHDFHTGGVGRPQRGEIRGTELGLRVQQGAVNIQGQQADGVSIHLHHINF